MLRNLVTPYITAKPRENGKSTSYPSRTTCLPSLQTGHTLPRLDNLVLTICAPTPRVNPNQLVCLLNHPSRLPTISFASYCCSVMSDSLPPYGLQHARPPCPSPPPEACSHTSIESVMPSNLCRPLLLLPSIFPSIRVFSNESALCIRWPKYGGFCFSVCPPNEYSRLITFRIFCKDPASTLPHQEFACPSSEFLWHLGTPPGKHTIQCHVHLFFYLWEFLEDRDS